MDSFKDVLEAAQLYCKGQMAEPTYNLYIDGLEPVSFEDSSHITLSVRNDFLGLTWTFSSLCPAPRPMKWSWPSSTT